MLRYLVKLINMNILNLLIPFREANECFFDSCCSVNGIWSWKEVTEKFTVKKDVIYIVYKEIWQNQVLQSQYHVCTLIILQLIFSHSSSDYTTPQETNMWSCYHHWNTFNISTVWAQYLSEEILQELLRIEEGGLPWRNTKLMKGKRISMHSWRNSRNMVVASMY